MVGILFTMGRQVPDVIKTFWKSYKTAAEQLCQEDNHHSNCHHHCHYHYHHQHHAETHIDTMHWVLRGIFLLCLLDGWGGAALAVS